MFKGEFCTFFSHVYISIIIIIKIHCIHLKKMNNHILLFIFFKWKHPENSKGKVGRMQKIMIIAYNLKLQITLA